MGMFNKKVVRARIVGVRTAMDTKVLGTENYGVYSFLVEYEDGKIDVKEVKYGSIEMKELLLHVRM